MPPLKDLDRRRLFVGAASLAALAPAARALAALGDPFAASPWRRLTDADWKKRLPVASYAVLRHAGTEPPFTSPLNNEHQAGTFVCLGCGLPLFKSTWKFDSGTGWPSFYTALAGAVSKRHDFELVVERTEYHCARCLGHQGHIFNDGPKPTGLRYCNDGVALRFVRA
ncbi:MAG: peptide-methionine (R)-S-oxide reductase MsrB [Caulobacteraceae bacterium]